MTLIPQSAAFAPRTHALSLRYPICLPSRPHKHSESGRNQSKRRARNRRKRVVEPGEGEGGEGVARSIAQETLESVPAQRRCKVADKPGHFGQSRSRAGPAWRTVEWAVGIKRAKHRCNTANTEWSKCEALPGLSTTRHGSAQTGRNWVFLVEVSIVVDGSSVPDEVVVVDGGPRCSAGDGGSVHHRCFAIWACSVH